jgi:hypothetical protein
VPAEECAAAGFVAQEGGNAFLLLLPVRRVISFVPMPSDVSNTICERQTCFCGLFRFATIASSQTRSAGVISTVIPVRKNRRCSA